MLRAVLVRLFAAAILAAAPACGGGGAVVLQSPTGNPGWAYCHDDYTAEEAAQAEGQFFSGQTCEGLGFTKACPADGENTYRLPQYQC